MAKDKYLIILAAVAGAALFFAGVYALEYKYDDEGDDAPVAGDYKTVVAEMDNTVTVQEGLCEDGQFSPGAQFDADRSLS